MKQQTAVEQAFDWIISNIEFRGESDKKRFLSNKKRFMKIEKEQIVNELKLIGNAFDVGKLDAKEQSHHIRFTSIIKDRIKHYSDTYENPNT